MIALPRQVKNDDKVSDVDPDGSCQCCSATGGLKRDCQDVHDACQDDAKSDDIDVKQVA